MKKIMKLILVGMMSLACVACGNGEVKEKEVNYKMTQVYIPSLKSTFTGEILGIFGSATLEKEAKKLSFELNSGQVKEAYTCTFAENDELLDLKCSGFADAEFTASLNEEEETLFIYFFVEGEMLRYDFEKE